MLSTIFVACMVHLQMPRKPSPVTQLMAVLNVANVMPPSLGRALASGAFVGWRPVSATIGRFQANDLG
jgi:hypothetical protein